ncbi:hypothetical protein M5K25_014370 [Dendrobium thyrsiflorum]|uniref:Uncharacterized protein n=1 Tax=Dendrobium thyrsiflorum TaxID=117978 RepID=A0ABD0V2H9_DENTH
MSCRGIVSGSSDYFDYYIWSQAASAYEGQASGASSFSASSHTSLYSQQVANLIAEIENVQKSQLDIHMQILKALQKMIEQISGNKPAPVSAELKSEEIDFD